MRTLMLVLGFCVSATAAGAAPYVDSAAVKALNERGSVRLIVNVHDGAVPSGTPVDVYLRSVLPRRESAAIAVIDRTTAVVAVKSRRALDAIAKQAAVKLILMDKPMTGNAQGASSPSTASPHEALLGLWAAGMDGSGVAVAIVDSAIDAAHPQLAGKVVRQACFSVKERDGRSDCSGGRTLATEEVVDTAPNAASNCTSPESMCRHGTHVAATIAGNSQPSATGIAPGATLVVAQVIGENGGGFHASVLRALTWIESQVAEYRATGDGVNIVAVNLSLGTSALQQQPCDELPEAALISKRIRSLKADGVAVFVAAGNNGGSGVGVPACSRDALRVGAVDADSAITDFTNRPPLSFASLFARGTDVVSAVPGGGYQALSGTSMATAIASGTYAVLKAAYPKASVDDIQESLAATGLPISRAAGMPYRSIDASLAAGWLKARFAP